MVGHCALDVQCKTESVHAVAHGQALTSEHDINEVMHYIVKKHIGSNRAVHLLTFSFRHSQWRILRCWQGQNGFGKSHGTSYLVQRTNLVGINLHIEGLCNYSQRWDNQMCEHWVTQVPGNSLCAVVSMRRVEVPFPPLVLELLDMIWPTQLTSLITQFAANNLWFIESNAWE